jgi:polyketide biosynthesis enoyl-CoA hydratase PksI
VRSSAAGSEGGAPLFAVTHLDAGVAVVRIASDAEPYMGMRWVDRLDATLNHISRDSAVQAIVLEGGERAFSLGASRDDLVAAAGRGAMPGYVGQVPRSILAVPVPVVAAMAGHAIGGGLLLGLWCDVAVLAAESLYGANFMALGFTPGMGATHAVPEAFGGPLGRELLYTGRLLTGREIREAHCPLSGAVRPRVAVMRRAVAVARQVAGAPRPAVVALKRRLSAARREALKRALRAEEEGHARLFADPSMARQIAERYGAGLPAEDAGVP